MIQVKKVKSPVAGQWFREPVCFLNLSLFAQPNPNSHNHRLGLKDTAVPLYVGVASYNTSLRDVRGPSISVRAKRVHSTEECQDVQDDTSHTASYHKLLSMVVLSTLRPLCHCCVLPHVLHALLVNTLEFSTAILEPNPWPLPFLFTSLS